MCADRPARGDVRRRPDRGRGRGAQLRGHQVPALGHRPAGQRPGGRPADGPRATRRRSCTARRPACTTPPAPRCSTRRRRSATTTGPIMPTYSISKIAAEQVVATMCRHLEIPTTIARLNVPYGVGPDGTARGWPAFHIAMMEAGMPIPVDADRPNLFNPIELTDIAATVPALVDAATVPATTVNWAGVEQVSLEEWCEYLADHLGLEVTFEVTDATIGGVTVDTVADGRAVRPDHGRRGATGSPRWPTPTGRRPERRSTRPAERARRQLSDRVQQGVLEQLGQRRVAPDLLTGQPVGRDAELHRLGDLLHQRRGLRTDHVRAQDRARRRGRPGPSRSPWCPPAPSRRPHRRSRSRPDHVQAVPRRAAAISVHAHRADLGVGEHGVGHHPLVDADQLRPGAAGCG